MKFAASVFMALGLVSSASAELTTDSRAGRELLAHARRVGDSSGEFDFVGQYSIKFQGCHHVQQWNSNADNNNNNNNNNGNNNNNNNEDQVRIMTKRLVRFRLCPIDSCNSERSTGCSAKFGDYIVDMNTFVSYYVDSLAEEKDSVCGQMEEYCTELCGENGDADCEEACYDSGDAAFCLETDLAEQYGFNVGNYLECAKANIGRRKERSLADQVQYYIGPFCAAQGGEVHLGVFTDDTCTTRADNGDSTFASAMGYNLPYSEDSLISNRCLKCGYSDGNGNMETSENCAAIYQYSGKCETRMNIDYPNESSCDYIEGIKIIREDGVIRTSSVRKSKAAAVFIGLFICLSVLLAGYVFYLRTKLSRAQINLAASASPLT